MNNVTLVTGLWNIKRSELKSGWNRSFEDHYIPKFRELLKVKENIIVFGHKELEQIVFEHRTTDNTLFIERDISWFKNNFYEKIQSIRTNPDWYNQTGWLRDSTQGSLELYNPLVLSKMFLLHDAKIFDKFDSDLLFWIDAGITNTVHPGYFTHDKVLDKLGKTISKFSFISFPYNAESDIHGFTFPDINKFAGHPVKLVSRGGFFGGPKNCISEVNSLYYNELQESLEQGYMGTEESIFSILSYKYSDLIYVSEIEENGLIGTFFENVKNGTVKFKTLGKSNITNKALDYSKVGLYVMTYNSPNQFRQLCESMEKYDKDFLRYPQKFLLNNSLNRDTDEEYNQLCEKYNFLQIKKDNIGICGGRQFIAEHFDSLSDLDYYLFFEDDMFFYVGDNTTCRNGFTRKIPNLYTKGLQIANRENFDFLKFNFSEFFGDNTKQWSWHNVPADAREKLFPENPVKTSNSIKDVPFLKFNNIKSYNGIPYATGEIYYCNWPQIVSREGNKKMFLETVWEHPYEQTWMSYIFQETRKGKISSGILLATPTEHDRFDHYTSEERREN